MPLNQLFEGGGFPEGQPDVQRATQSVDVWGRYICSTLDEAASSQVGNNYTMDYDAIVIGAGMYGAHCAEQLHRLGKRVLVLEAGPFLLSQHNQNLGNIAPYGPSGIGAGSAFISAEKQNEINNSLIWGMPWRGNQQFVSTAFCVGGKSLFWGGWCPRITESALSNTLTDNIGGEGAGWPAETAEYLRRNYRQSEIHLGVRELPPQNYSPDMVACDCPVKSEKELETDFFDKGPLAERLKERAGELLEDTPKWNEFQVETAPVAVHSLPTAAGSFASNKYSSVPALAQAIRQDIAGKSAGTSDRNLVLVPNVRVRSLLVSGDRVVAMQLQYRGETIDISLTQDTDIVMALSSVESTRLVQDSGFPDPNRLIGRNLMVHLRNNFVVRVRRSALGLDPGAELQTAAFHLQAKASNGADFHYQVVAGSSPDGSGEDIWYRMIPDPQIVRSLVENQDPEWVSIFFRGTAEMKGNLEQAPGDHPDDRVSYQNLSRDLVDEQGDTRAWVHLATTPFDDTTWDELDTFGYEFALALANNNPDDFEFPAGFVGQTRDLLGSTYHEAGTLWMGQSSDDSVTDSTGRFHLVRNAYCCDQALYPRYGSANPVPTGLTLASRVAEAVAGYSPDPTVRPLFRFTGLDTNPVKGWQHLGNGGFKHLRSGNGARGVEEIIETEGGIGLLVFRERTYKDFILTVEWASQNRAAAGNTFNNSGVYVRIPETLRIDGEERSIFELTDDQVQTYLIRAGYEVQIDDTGFLPEERFSGDPNGPRFGQLTHNTGAIYPVFFESAPEFDLPDFNGRLGSPARDFRSTEVGQWNQLRIEARGNNIKVYLNGFLINDATDSNNAFPEGYVAIQNHFSGPQMQFRRATIQEI